MHFALVMTKQISKRRSRMKQSENEILTRVGADTPAGNMLRRYWHPIGLSADLLNTPKLVKLLGEELVLFRKPDGVCGLLDSRCAHRGASLAAGYIDEGGIRCPYHGWQFGTGGQCLDQPCEPADNKLKDRVRQKSYAVEELAGLVFAYIGPEPRPLLPRLDVMIATNGLRHAKFARYLPVNWLQIVDNHMDPTHTTWLHKQMSAWQETPECHYFRTELGTISVAARKGPKQGTRYVREVHFFMPNGLKVPLPSGKQSSLTQPSTIRCAWVVPMDDYNTMEWELIFAPFDEHGRPTEFNSDSDPALYRMDPPAPFAEYISPGTNSYPDYEMGGATGTTVLTRQDTLVQASQGLIQPREHEHLASSDRGVMLSRQVLKECIDAVAAGEDPRGVIRDATLNRSINVEVAELIMSEEEYQYLLRLEGLDAVRVAQAAK
jgi:5,5'-dehydrodivanillate O-demethylase